MFVSRKRLFDTIVRKLLKMLNEEQYCAFIRQLCDRIILCTLYDQNNLEVTFK